MSWNELIRFFGYLLFKNLECVKKTSDILLYYEPGKIFFLECYHRWISIGLAVNSRQDTLFVASDDGRVKELSLSATQSSQVRDSWSLKSGQRVRGLSVDWLFSHLYLLIESGDYPITTWKISRCLFSGRQFTDIVSDIPLKPSQIEVDPFNG